MDKVVIILRGVPGAGKSTFARWLVTRSVGPGDMVVVSNDHYFEKDGKYDWDPRKIPLAVEQCHANFIRAVRDRVLTVIVDNMNCNPADFAKYEEIARAEGYKVVHLVVENRHGSVNIHRVPEHKVRERAGRFDIRLAPS